MVSDIDSDKDKTYNSEDTGIFFSFLYVNKITNENMNLRRDFQYMLIFGLNI